MMLMKLLHTTNTLSEAKDQPHRYKVRAGGLPTFGNATEPAVRNFGGASAARAKVSTPPLPVKGAASAGWAQKLNPFAKQGAPIERTAVQGELSLDKVKPLRNDLSDTDLELVSTVKPPDGTPGVVKVVPVWQRVRGLIQRLRP